MLLYQPAVFLLLANTLGLSQLKEDRWYLSSTQFSGTIACLFLVHFLSQTRTLHNVAQVFLISDTVCGFRTCAGDAVAQQNAHHLGRVLKPHRWEYIHYVSFASILTWNRPFHLKAGLLILRDVKKDVLMSFLYPEFYSPLWLQNGIGRLQSKWERPSCFH